MVGLAASVAVLVPQLRGDRASSAVFDGEAAREQDDGPLGPLLYIAWLTGFVVLIALVGYFLALLIFFVAFMRRVARASWLQTAILTGAAALLIMTLASALNLQMPGGLLQDRYYLHLPWPLR